MRSDAYQISSSKMQTEMCVALYLLLLLLFNECSYHRGKKRDPNNDMRMVERKERSRIRCASQNCESISGRPATFFSPRRLEKLAWIVFHQSPRQKRRNEKLIIMKVTCARNEFFGGLWSVGEATFAREGIRVCVS